MLDDARASHLAILGLLRTDPAFQRLCQEKQPRASAGFRQVSRNAKDGTTIDIAAIAKRVASI
jgi:hypothetical protein